LITRSNQTAATFFARAGTAFVDVDVHHHHHIERRSRPGRRRGRSYAPFAYCDNVLSRFEQDYRVIENACAFLANGALWQNARG
jgi:hypothetical protein